MKKMITKKTVKSLFLVITIAFFSISCDSEDPTEIKEKEPVLLEEFFFRGEFDGKPFDLTRKFYDFSDPTINNPGSKYRLDFGGTIAKQRVSGISPNEIETCEPVYTCGIVPFSRKELLSIPPPIIMSGKIFLNNIYKGNCNLQNEEKEILNVFESEIFTYKESGIDTPRSFEFLYTPSIPRDSSEPESYSSEIGDNKNSMLEITSINKKGIGEVDKKTIYDIEGIFSCKMYSITDKNKVKELKNGKFKIRIKTNFINE